MSKSTREDVGSLVIVTHKKAGEKAGSGTLTDVNRTHIVLNGNHHYPRSTHTYRVAVQETPKPPRKVVQFQRVPGKGTMILCDDGILYHWNGSTLEPVIPAGVL